jgi:hypothetical protein
MPSGGSRPGAGRPRKNDRNQTPVADAEKRCADRLPRTFDNLEQLADGEAIQLEAEDTWQAAGTVVIQVGLFDDEGQAIIDEKGKPKLTRKLAFPDRDPEELVLVKRERKKIEYPPDRQANEYLADRVMGKPRQSVEHTGEDGEAIKHAVTIYLPDNGRRDNPDVDPTAEGTPGAMAQ